MLTVLASKSQAAKGYIDSNPAADGDQNIIVSANQNVTFTVHPGTDQVTSCSGSFENTGGSFNGTFTGSKSVVFGDAAKGKSSLCTITISTTGTKKETCSTSDPIEFHVIIYDIKTETVHEAPSNSDKHRLVIGVGEEVTLSVQPQTTNLTDSDVQWSLDNQGDSFDPADTTTGLAITYKASLDVGGDSQMQSKVHVVSGDGQMQSKVHVAIKGAQDAAPAKVFNRTAPTPSVHQDPDNKTIYHRHNKCSAGFSDIYHMGPDTVSYDGLYFAEEMGSFAGTGYFTNQNGAQHETSEIYTLLDSKNNSIGPDLAWSGIAMPPGSGAGQPVYGTGASSIDIAVDISDRDDGTNSYKLLTTIHQEADSDPQGKCTEIKSGVNLSRVPGDPEAAPPH